MVTSIQMAYVTLDLRERDVIRVDQTGSVKTVVFVLPTAMPVPCMP
jgi:superfamily II DNA/RNA helicase